MKWLQRIGVYFVAPLIVAIIGGIAVASYIGEGSRFANDERFETPDASTAPSTVLTRQMTGTESEPETFQINLPQINIPQVYCLYGGAACLTWGLYVYLVLRALDRFIS